MSRNRFSALPDFRHDDEACSGILLTNLGTPAAPDTGAVRDYLAEFLADPRVVEQPRWLWWLALHGIILRTRPKKVAASYRKIWTDDGSPLMVISQQQVQKLQTALEPVFTGKVRVELGMRYGQPSIAAGLQKLRAGGARRILVLPLYPQYSATTTASTLDAVSDELKNWRWVPELRFVSHYHDHPAYIHALGNSIERKWQADGRPDKLLMSFHGLPQRYFEAGDPYYCECHKTARLLAEKLALAGNDWQLTFQSRFGPEQWLQPYTSETLQTLAQSGTRHVQIVCPGFSADCLETLEEISEENREVFINAGGRQFDYIPALNTEQDHISMMVELVRQHAGDWLSLQTGPGVLARARQQGADQ